MYDEQKKYIEQMCLKHGLIQEKSYGNYNGSEVKVISYKIPSLSVPIYGEIIRVFNNNYPYFVFFNYLIRPISLDTGYDYIYYPHFKGRFKCFKENHIQYYSPTFKKDVNYLIKSAFNQRNKMELLKKTNIITNMFD